MAKKALPAQGSDAIMRALSEANSAMLKGGAKKTPSKASNSKSKKK